MPTIESNSVVINRSIEEVFAFMTDIEKWSQWASEVVEAKKTSEGPVGVGTTFSFLVQFLGRRMEGTNEVTDYAPNSKFAFKTTSGPVSAEDEITFESVTGGTKVTRVSRVETGGFFKLAEPILTRTAQRQFETNFANLKDLLEAQAQGSA
ncbi:MAG: hypothetical protein GTN71_08145 [Anaerolineae bacterium]|nr:hypothetical protein [Anaerolineae bacterium]